MWVKLKWKFQVLRVITAIKNDEELSTNDGTVQLELFAVLNIHTPHVFHFWVIVKLLFSECLEIHSPPLLTSNIRIRKQFIKHASVGAEIIHWYEKELQKVKEIAFEGILG